MKSADITPNHLRSYAQACRELNMYIRVLCAEGYDLLIVPSRGASPFLHGAYSYAHHSRKQYEDFDPMAPRLRYLETLYLPFTADIGNDSPIDSASIRNYWARVLAAMIRRDDADIARRFYQYLRSNAGSLAIGQDHISCGKSGKFIFVDTVVSGRAICEIFQAFEQYDLGQCHFVLLVDYMGTKLERHYDDEIRQMKQSNRATIIHVERIFTEDEGPAMSGIWSVTLPEVMLSMQRIIPELANDNCLGAGLYYHEVSMRESRSNEGITISNAILSTMLFAAVGDREKDQASAEYFLQCFQDHIKTSKLQDQAATQRIADPVIYGNLPNIQSTDVSGSHVLRARMDPGKADAFIRTFLAS